MSHDYLNSEAEGQTHRADEANADLPSASEPELPGEGHILGADEAPVSVPPAGQPELSGEGHSLGSDKAVIALPSAGQPPSSKPDLEPTIAQIRYWHRTRNFAMEQRKRMDLALGSFLRIALGWSKALPEDERKRIAAQAAALVDMGEREAKGKPLDAEEPAYDEWREVIAGSLLAREPFARIEKEATKHMERLAETLPVWAAFGDGVRGFGPRGLAVIVGEAGNLGAYPKKGHLWKRMGLAVMGDTIQGRLPKGAPKALWIEHGYNAKRRSQMWNIGKALVKQGENYREVYLRRKAFERARAEASGLKVAPSAAIKGREGFISDGHIDRRAQRYMEKRLLRDLWQAWRDGERANLAVPTPAVQRLPSPQPDAAEAGAGFPQGQAASASAAP